MKTIHKLTICIISHNRGSCALRQLIAIKDRLGDCVSVLVLDNGSTYDCEGYIEIQKISQGNEKIKYHRHQNNIQVYGNLISCFELAETPYIQVMSDEDFPNVTMLHESIDVLEEFCNVAVIRGSIGKEEGKIGRNSLSYPDSFFPAGENALCNFFLRTNYISGVIYNRFLINKTDFIERLKNKSILHQAYPHMYLDCLCASKFDIMLTSTIACWEGPEDPRTIGAQVLDIGTTGFSGRLAQFLAFRDLINDIYTMDIIENKLATAICLYELLCIKYFYLLKCDSFIFRRLNISPSGLEDALLHFALASCNMEIFQGYENIVHERIYQSYYKSKLISS